MQQRLTILSRQVNFVSLDMCWYERACPAVQSYLGTMQLQQGDTRATARMSSPPQKCHVM